MSQRSPLHPASHVHLLLYGSYGLCSRRKMGIIQQTMSIEKQMQNIQIKINQKKEKKKKE